MKYYRTIPEHVAERRVAAGLRCDRCGGETDQHGHWPGVDTFDTSEAGIRALIGATYPEGDFRTGYTADVCPPCFIGHVLPALRAAGVTVAEYEAEEAEPVTERPTPQTEATA